MSRLFLIIVLASTNVLAASAQPTGRDIVKKMHDRYAGKWYGTFQFAQTTEVYRNDSLQRTQIWHEYIRFPERFRMDFGAIDSGNAAIFRRDSCYRFRAGILQSTTINNNEGLIFLLGGMYFYPLDQAYKIFDSLHYDLQKGHEDSWQGHRVYVIGANKTEDAINQLWIDKEDLYPVRMIKIDPRSKLEARFENWLPMSGGGWLETKCSFYVNGKLAQVETYHDYKTNVFLDDRIFDPTNLIRPH